MFVVLTPGVVLNRANIVGQNSVVGILLTLGHCPCQQNEAEKSVENISLRHFAISTFNCFHAILFII